MQGGQQIVDCASPLKTTSLKEVAVHSIVASKTIVAAVAIGLLASCASGPKEPKEATLTSEVVAAADINPNRRETAQPVKLHVFYLKQDEAFLQATFNDLIMPDSPAIAADLVRRTEGLVGPGETIYLDDKFDESAKFIGVISEFTRIDQAEWRSIVAVPEGSWKDLLTPFKDKKLQITVAGLAVSCAIVED